MRLSVPIDHPYVVRFMELSKLQTEEQAIQGIFGDAFREKWGPDLADDSGYMEVSIDFVAHGKIHFRPRYLFNSSEAQQLLKTVSSLTLCAEYYRSQIRSCEVEAVYNIGEVDDEVWTTITLELGSRLAVNRAVLDFTVQQQDHPAVTALAIEFGG